MRKSVTKIVKAVLGFTMAIGAFVGAATSSPKASRVVAAPATVSVTISEYATANSWTGSGGGPYKTVQIDSHVTASLSSVGGNSGKYYTDWRLYQSEDEIITISTDSGTLSSITYTYSSNNSGVLATVSGQSVEAANRVNSGTAKSVSGSSYSLYVANTSTKTNGQARITAISVTYEPSSGEETTYTGVTVSEKTALTGTYKGDAYYDCQASVTGTGSFSSTVTWSITSSDTYGTGTSISNKASINANGRITFLDNCTVYVWATAADETTHNTTGFAVVASELLDNPINSWTKITDTNDVSVNKVYALSNDKVYFAGNAVASNVIAQTTSLSSIGYVVLESAASGYYVRFATNTNDVWTASGNYIKWANDGTKLSSTVAKDSTYGTWNVVANGENGVYLKNVSSSRHLGLNGTTDVRAYASSNIAGNAPVYLWEAGSLPVINCDTIELTGKPSDPMSLGDTATLGYYALGTDANVWTGDVVYSISNESTSGVVELSATSGVSVTLTAKKVGTARVSVRDKDENATADYVDITVLADPERTELPVGNYDVDIDYSTVKKDDEVPASKSYEIKAKEGTGAGRVWYKNMTIAYSNVTASYDTEYTFSKDGSASTATVTTTSEVAKVTQVVISYYNGNRLTLTDASSNEISVASSVSNVCTYVLNSPSFTLSSTTTTTSIYSIQITFTAVNENEEFLSLVINKGVTASSFTEGDAPNAIGLTVHENYSTDGSSISRYEDVTESVTWNYSIETIGEKTTSYTVTATYGGHTSDPVTIDGFTVTPIAKYSLFESEITEGDYIIHYNGKALQNTISSNKATYFEIEPRNNVILTNDANIVWHIAQDGDYYTIYNAAVNKYLASTNSNNQAKLESSVTDNSRWTVQMSNGEFEFINKARSGVDNKYLRENTTYGFACYSSSTGGALTLYRATVETYLKSASSVATYTEEEGGNILRLGSSITIEKWASILAVGEITDYGVMIYKTDSEANITSKTPVEDAYRNSGVTPAIARKGNGVPPTATDGNYVFTARVKVANADTVFCAASFVVIGGQYYFFNEQHITARGLGA